MPYHNDYPGELETGKGPEYPQDHGATAKPVERLGPRAAHPLALTGGQHDGCQPGLLAGPLRARAAPTAVVVAHPIFLVASFLASKLWPTARRPTAKSAGTASPLRRLFVATRYR